MKNPAVIFLGYARLHGFKKIISQNYAFLKYSNIYLSIDGPKNKKDIFIQNKIVSYFQETFENIKIQRLKTNKGCALAIPEGIKWFFKHEKEGIILEDDIFCETGFLKLSKRYLNNLLLKESFSYLIGYNPFYALNTRLFKNILTIYPSRFNKIWGWATTKNTWDLFDPKICNEPFFLLWRYTKGFSDLFMIRIFFFLLALQTRQNKNSAWDIQFFFSLAKHKKVQIISGKNFVTNYGYDAVSTHCNPSYKPSPISNNSFFSSIRLSPEFYNNDAILYKCAFEISLYKIIRQILVLFVPFSVFYFVRFRLRPFLVRFGLSI